MWFCQPRLQLESKQPMRFLEAAFSAQQSQTCNAITWTHEIDVTVEEVPSNSTTAGEAPTISNEADNTPNAFHLPPSEFTPVHNEGRLVPPRILLWLRSQLAIEEQRMEPFFLTVTWWQPVPMRLFSLEYHSSLIDYRLHHSESPPRHSKCVSWWRAKSMKNPSSNDINRVCGAYRLIYLHTVGVLEVGELTATLQKHFYYHKPSILAIFPFRTNTWEILVRRDYVDDFITCAQHCDYHVEDSIYPGHSTGDHCDLQSYFMSSMKARERLVGRASFAQVVSTDNPCASDVATIYRDLVKLYRCYKAYETIVSHLIPTDQPLYSPRWSCAIGSLSYPTKNAVPKEQYK